jgi:hypothetical protein
MIVSALSRLQSSYERKMDSAILAILKLDPQRSETAEALAEMTLVQRQSPEPLPSTPPAVPSGAYGTAAAFIHRRSSAFGEGCVLQGVALVMAVLAIATAFTVVGPIIFGVLALWLFIRGSLMATWLECSACGSRLSHRGVEVCPFCRANF